MFLTRPDPRSQLHSAPLPRRQHGRGLRDCATGQHHRPDHIHLASALVAENSVIESRPSDRVQKQLWVLSALSLFFRFRTTCTSTPLQSLPSSTTLHLNSIHHGSVLPFPSRLRVDQLRHPARVPRHRLPLRSPRPGPRLLTRTPTVYAHRFLLRRRRARPAGPVRLQRRTPRGAQVQVDPRARRRCALVCPSLPGCR